MSPSPRIYRSGVTAPPGFSAAGIHAGIKSPGELDLALILSERAGSIGGVFTQNQIIAAPVELCRAHLRKGRGQAICINSGNANAFTGEQGKQDTRLMAKAVATHLQIPIQTVFISSTGIIGQPLPLQPMIQALPTLIKKLDVHHGSEAARAILTTDTTIKEVVVKGKIGNCPITIGGMAKGSGMIHPNMATMLAFLTTDATIAPKPLQRALRIATEQSFNCISVDGDTSTNDMVLCLANGHSPTTQLDHHPSAQKTFQALLNEACHQLALLIAQDGEGATKLVRLHVKEARTRSQAKQVVSTIGTSPLVKTALFGEDANWGRIIAAAGRAGVQIRAKRLGLAFDQHFIVRNGEYLGEKAENRVAKIVKKKQFSITLYLGQGQAESELWTTDLSYDYVKINASYRS